MACLPGETSQEEWKRRIQENPGPWGELATDNIILTVPTANLRTLENPEPLLRLWDEVMQAVARLGAEPFPLRLPQRIVADVQISVGGYLGRTSACCPPPQGLPSCNSHAVGSQQGRNVLMARHIKCNPCYLNGKGKNASKKKKKDSLCPPTKHWKLPKCPTVMEWFSNVLCIPSVDIKEDI